MTPELTVNGVTVRTFDEVYADLESQYKAIYGSDIDLSQNTPDGQKIGIIAKLMIDMESFGLNLYSQFDPDFSQGEVLNKIVKLAGISRSPATKSQVDVTITTDRNLTLTAGFTVEDENGNLWITSVDRSLLLGDNAVSLLAENSGAISASAGTITTPVTIVLGVQSVANPAGAVQGLNEETDELLRIRRNRSLQRPAYSTVGSLFSKLVNISGVNDISIYENATSTHDDTFDLAPHSIWAVVEGGAISDIIETIAKEKTAGTGLKGSTLGTYNETLLRSDGSSFTIPHDMKFDRPAYTAMYINLTVTRKDSAVPVDTDLIKEKLTEVNFKINQSAVVTELYGAIYSAGNSFIATVLEISDDGIAYVNSSLDNGLKDIFTVDATNIDITEIIP